MSLLLHLREERCKICKGNVSECTKWSSCSRTFGYGKYAYILTHKFEGVNSTAQKHIANNGMWTLYECVITDPEHSSELYWARARTVCWCTCVHTSHLWLKVSPCVSFHIIHACARIVSCLLSGLSSPVSLLLPPVLLPALFDVHPGAWWDLHWRSPGVRLQLGEHGHSGLCHTLTGYEPKEWSDDWKIGHAPGMQSSLLGRWVWRMELTDADELNLATSSDIFDSRTPWTTWLPSPTFLTSTTMSLRNSLQLWSIEQGNLLRWEAHRQILQRHLAPNQNSGMEGSIAKLMQKCEFQSAPLCAEIRRSHRKKLCNKNDAARREAWEVCLQAQKQEQGLRPAFYSLPHSMGNAGTLLEKARVARTMVNSGCTMWAKRILQANRNSLDNSGTPRWWRPEEVQTNRKHEYVFTILISSWQCSYRIRAVFVGKLRRARIWVGLWSGQMPHPRIGRIIFCKTENFVLLVVARLWSSSSASSSSTSFPQDSPSTSSSPASLRSDEEESGNRRDLHKTQNKNKNKDCHEAARNRLRDLPKWLEACHR